jgi:F-type H+-transporting ATPase subunit b
MNINLTLLGQAISFALFVFFCMKFVWPPMTAALAERQKRIADGLERR